MEENEQSYAIVCVCGGTEKLCFVEALQLRLLLLLNCDSYTEPTVSSYFFFVFP